MRIILQTRVSNYAAWLNTAYLMHDRFLSVLVNGYGGRVDPRLCSHVTKTDVGIPAKQLESHTHLRFDG